MPPQSPRANYGFTLVETVVAAALVATAVVVLAHLVALGAEQGAGNRHALAAMIAAQSKLEELRSLSWTYALDGTPLSDAGLSPSPLRSLFEDAPGYAEFLDDAGAIVPEGDADSWPVLVRRWAILPLVPADTDTVVLQVCVFRAGRAREHPEACVSAVRTRKP